MKSVSVIIPSFGQIQYLRQAIDSVINQTHQCEIVIVDDGSTDGSIEVAESYGEAIKLIKQTNKGLASARNAGIMNATGDYIMFLDADDKMRPDCIERVLEYFEKENADVVCPSIRCFNEKGIINDTILMPYPTFGDFEQGNRLAYCCAYKKSVLLETGGYSPKMDVLGGYEDLHLHYDMLRRGKKIVTIPEPLVMYRIKEKSMWRDATKNHKGLWDQIIKDFPEAAHHYHENTTR